MLVLRAWGAAAVLAAAAVAGVLPTLTPTGAFAQADGVACGAEAAAFRVVSFNAQFGEADPGRLAAQIRDEDPDAVILVEATEPLIRALLVDEGLAEALPERSGEVSTGGASGSVILSAHPLRDEDRAPGSAFDQPTAVAAVPGFGDVRLVAVHPHPPIPGARLWRDGLGMLDRWLEAAPDETLIVAGDFNASYAHPAFRELAGGFVNASAAAGPIPWPTWPESDRPIPAFTAIDHVLVRGGAPAEWRSFAVEGSDHRGVAAGLRLCGA
nr:endonuclease/exonuclease/phosphatase family protein [Leucobacter weissii]